MTPTMTKMLFSLLFLPALCWAQPALVTEFPAESAPLTSDALKARFTGNVFTFKAANGAELRLQFQSTHVFVNAPANNDSGPWKAEGSAVCIDFSKFPSGCNEVRSVGDTLYWKRASNGEVVRLIQK